MMRVPVMVGVVLVVGGLVGAARGDLGNPTPEEARAYAFERSLFEGGGAAGDLKPLAEEKQRALV